VSGIPHTKPEDEVMVISNDSSDPNSIESLAKRMGSITYQVAVRIPAHLKRVIV
jgi:hypothetical protein